MLRQRPILVLIVLPAVVSLAITLLVLTIWDQQRPQQRVIMLPTHSSTAMIAPRSTLAARPSAEAAETTSEGENSSQEPPVDINSVTGLPTAGCQNPTHTVQAGEVLGSIAEQYHISVDDLITMNQQFDPNFNKDFLSVGQELVVPICGIPTEAPTEAVQEQDTTVPTRNVPAPIATATNPPPGEISVVLSRVVNPGDITSEALEIVNQGSPVDLEGWTIKGSKGSQVFTFPAFRLFSGGGVTIFTGVGEDTPIDLYWGLDNAVWEIGETVSLFDSDGKVQDTLDISE